MEKVKKILFLCSLFLAVLLLVSFNDSNPDEEYSLEEMQKGIDKNGYSFIVGDTGLSDYTISDLCGFIPPSGEKFRSGIKDPEPIFRAVPDSFSWQAQGLVTSVKAQGNCGACWAFASNGCLESVVKIHDGIDDNLSEQWLISCTNAGSCDGAESHAFGYMKNGTAKESCFPYRAANVSCKSGCSLYYPLQDYANLLNTVENLKNAIYQYGPIFTSVYIDSYLKNYNGGVYDRNSNGINNHAVILVGWDDSKGAWHMKNSWGPGWGENGYMWIKYGVQGIGQYSAYCNYKGPVTPDQTPIPTPAPTSTPEPVNPGKTVSLQAEDAYYYDAVSESKNSGYTGRGYINTTNQAGGYIEWTVNAASPMQAACSFVYANGGSAGRPAYISVNGSIVASNLDFPVTGAWTTWSQVTLTVNLNPGINTIRLTGMGSEGAANIDRNDITFAETPTPEPTPNQVNRGDVNGNGPVDIVDGLLVAQYYVGLNPSNFNASAADTNCNGTVDIVDALLIAQYYVRLISDFCM